MYGLIGEVADGATLEFEEQSYHFSKIEVDGNFLTFTAVRVDGSVIESFTIELGEEVISAPTVTDDTGEVTAGASVSGNVLSNDTTSSSSELVVTAVNGVESNVGISIAGSTGGVFAIQADGSYTFAAINAYETLGITETETSSVTYTATVDGMSTTGTLTITITGSNTAPVVTDESGSVSRTSTISGNVLTNDTDVNVLDGLSVVAVNSVGADVGNPVAGSSGGIFTIGIDGDYTFDPGSDFDDLAESSSRVTYVEYDVYDGSGGLDTGRLSITVYAAANTAPIVVDDEATIPANTAAVLDVLANDTDADGDTLTITAVTQGAHGTVVNNGTDLTYTPATNYSGTDTFTYTATDGNGHTDTATVTMTIEAAPNNAPAAVADSVTMYANASVIIPVLDNDIDSDGDALSITAVTQGTNGTVTHDGTSVTYTPNTDFVGTDSFTYSISDGKTGVDTGTVTVTVEEEVVSDPETEVTYVDPAGTINRVAICNNTYWDSEYAGFANAAERDAYYNAQFNSIYDWEQINARDLTATGSNECEVVEILTADLLSEKTIIENWTTDATHFILLRALGAARNAIKTGALDDNAAKVAATDGAPPFVIKNLTPLHMHIDGLQLETSLAASTGACISVEGSVGVVEIMNCYMDSTSTAYYGGGVDVTATSGTVVIGNCIINGKTQGITARSAGSVTIVFNSIVTGLTSDAIESDGNAVSVYNSAVFNNGTDFKDAFTVISNCASDSGDGTNPVALNENASGEWGAAFINYALTDFRINGASSPLYGAGMDVTGVHTDLLGQGVCSTDINGQVRTAWDIGPFKA